MGVWFCVPISRPIIVAVLLFVNRSFAIVGGKFYGFSSTEHPGCLRETGIDLGRVEEKTRNRKRSNSNQNQHLPLLLILLLCKKYPSLTGISERDIMS